MKEIYCDNGSTSFPKAPGLGEAIGRHIDRNGYNISRGGYSRAYSLEEEIIEARESVCRMFHWDNPRNVVFTSGATAGLNMILKGLLRKGDHVITTSMEHNAVVRPLAQLAEQGVSWTEAECSSSGRLDVEEVRKQLRPATKLVMAVHGSNVCGTLIPIEALGRLCRENQIYFCVDASQTAGSAVIDMEACMADAVVFPGHKALLGPQGVGGMIVRDSLAGAMAPLLAGGTGSASDSEAMPAFLPDRFQPGTLNIPGIIGLKHGIEFIRREGLEGMIEKKSRITGAFIQGTADMKGVRLVGLPSQEDRCSVVSLEFPHMDHAEVSYLLERDFGIMTRCGLHCAPHAHRSLGTFPQGTVRFSFGYFNTLKEVTAVIDALHKIVKTNR